jgi:hypothetical protein
MPAFPLFTSSCKATQRPVPIPIPIPVPIPVPIPATVAMPRQISTTAPVIVRIELSAAAREGSGGDPCRHSVRFTINDQSASGSLALAYDRAARNAS